MRLKIFCVVLVGVGFVGVALAQAPATTTATSQDSNASKPLSLERGQLAVAKVLSGRLKPPASYDQATPEQKAFVDSVLSGSRTELTGNTGTLMLSPAMGDLAQKAIAYRPQSFGGFVRRCALSYFFSSPFAPPPGCASVLALCLSL